MNTFNGCDRKRIAGFLQGTLGLDDKLEFLMHLDTCASCWNQIYAAMKSQAQESCVVVHPNSRRQERIRARSVRKRRRATQAV